MKILAMHLPQYHCFPENDEWWGKGFTDWTNVKKARPLYKGHEQPLVPLNNNYYDMIDIKTLINQSNLAAEYGVYGFCYYHYWFNKKLLMEKPCELLLSHKEINQNFCMCWANETWARTWDGKDKEILIKQEFGGLEDWKAHIDYLIPFFKDSRYIKISNRPVMFFYSCSRIEKFNEMITFWNSELKKNGISEIYVAEFVNSFNSGKSKIDSDVLVEFQPLCAARYSVSFFVKLKRLICKKLGIIDFLSYDYLWKKLLDYNETYNGKKLWRSCFVGFDNSPRKGKKSLIITGASPSKFGKYLRSLIKKNDRNFDDNFLVVNAWNEWAEGAVLEPTEKDGFGYLEQIKAVSKN